MSVPIVASAQRVAHLLATLEDASYVQQKPLLDANNRLLNVLYLVGDIDDHSTRLLSCPHHLQVRCR